MKACSCFVVFIALLLSALTSGQSQTTFCQLDCLPVDQSSITYCAGLLPYTSCVSPRDVTTQNADIRAFNSSQLAPKNSDSCACLEAEKQLFCALLFPKCANASPQATISQPVCRNTCVNYVARCNLTLTSQCDLTQGIGPDSNCTGNPLASALSCPLTRIPLPATDVRLIITFQTTLTDVQLGVILTSLPGILASSGVLSVSYSYALLPPTNDRRLAAFRFQGNTAGQIANFVANFAWSRPDYFRASNATIPLVYDSATSTYASGSSASTLTFASSVLLVLFATLVFGM